jgi:hypothetical protein
MFHAMVTMVTVKSISVMYHIFFPYLVKFGSKSSVDSINLL